jgi:pimeloyl-ACP methyl ester carboxylesterase
MAEAGIVRKDGIEMEYCRFGSGSRAFVILPGLTIQSVMGSKDAIEDEYAVMKDDFTTYVFDRRRDIADGYSIYDMADDTVIVMKELGLHDINLFGASQGGMIAMAIAVRCPELVKKIVLGSTSPHVKPEQREVIDSWIRLAQDRDREGLCLKYCKEIYPADAYEKNKSYFAEMAKVVTDEELNRFVILAKSIRDYDVSDELDKIECPVLALGAFEDAVLDSDATMEIAENLDHRPDFALYMYKGYGHAAFATAPDYRNRVHDFLMKE